MFTITSPCPTYTKHFGKMSHIREPCIADRVIDIIGKRFGASSNNIFSMPVVMPLGCGAASVSFATTSVGSENLISTKSSPTSGRGKDAVKTEGKRARSPQAIDSKGSERSSGECVLPGEGTAFCDRRNYKSARLLLGLGRRQQSSGSYACLALETARLNIGEKYL